MDAHEAARAAAEEWPPRERRLHPEHIRKIAAFVGNDTEAARLVSATGMWLKLWTIDWHGKAPEFTAEAIAKSTFVRRARRARRAPESA